MRMKITCAHKVFTASNFKGSKHSSVSLSTFTRAIIPKHCSWQKLTILTGLVFFRKPYCLKGKPKNVFLQRKYKLNAFPKGISGIVGASLCEVQFGPRTSSLRWKCHFIFQRAFTFENVLSTGNFWVSNMSACKIVPSPQCSNLTSVLLQYLHDPSHVVKIPWAVCLKSLFLR